MAVVTHVGELTAGAHLVLDKTTRMVGESGRKPSVSSSQRSDLNAALSSLAKMSGCSHAAKWPPFAARL